MTYAPEMLEKGSLQRSREVPVRLVARKCGLADGERDRTSACEDQAAPDAALDEILDADAKPQVLAGLS